MRAARVACRVALQSPPVAARAKSSIAGVKSGAVLPSTAGSAWFTASGTPGVERQNEVDLPVEGRLDVPSSRPIDELARLSTSESFSSGNESILSVLSASRTFFKRRQVGVAEHEQTVGEIERREHRPVEERRRVDDDNIVRLARNVEQRTHGLFADKLSILGVHRRGQHPAGPRNAPRCRP